MLFRVIWSSLEPYFGVIVGAIIGWLLSKGQRVADRRDEAKIAMLGHLAILDLFLNDPTNETAVKLWQEVEFPEFLKSMARQIPSLQNAISDLVGSVLRGLLGDEEAIDLAKKSSQGISEQLRRELGYYRYSDYRRNKRMIMRKQTNDGQAQEMKIQ